MKHIQWILPSVFALTAVSGCGLSEQDDDNAIIIEEQGPSASEAYQQALETYTGVTCERVFRCPEKADDDLLLVMAKYSSEQACQDNFSLVVLSDGADELIADGVAQGRILYDVEQARRCLAGIEDSVKGARCAFKFAGSVEEIPACEGMYQGQLEAGDTCALDEECQQGLYCAAISSQVCGGVCQAFASPGQGCGQGAAQCDSESTCLLEQGAQTGTCVANGSLSRGDTCSDSAQCDETSGCNRQGVCEALQNQPPLAGGADLSVSRRAVHPWTNLRRPRSPDPPGHLQGPRRAGRSLRSRSPVLQ